MSEDILARHERDGDISRSGAGYFCNVCSAPLGQQPLPHLQGTNHTNAIFLLTLCQPSRYWARYRDLPERIRTALERGEIDPKEKKVMCTICDVPLSREKTVNDHLSSSIHLMKVASGTFLATSSQPFSPRGAEQLPYWSPPIPHESSPQAFRPRGAAQSPNTLSLVFDESGLGQEAPSSTVERNDSIVTDALRKGHIKMVQVAGIGDAPMRQHLEGRPHSKYALKHELRASALPQLLFTPNRDVDQGQQRSFVNQHQIPHHHQVPNPSQQNEFSYQPNSQYHQNPTRSHQDEFNDQQNLQYHQNRTHSQPNEFNYQQNSTHQQNIHQDQRLNQQMYNIVNAFPSLTVNVTVGGSQMPHPPASSHPSSSDFAPRSSRGQPSSPYKIESSPRGIVVVFNYYFEGQGPNQRDGAAADYQNLKEVFTKIDYEVWPELIDLTKSETLEKLDEIRSSKRLGKVDSFIIFFLSHGGDTTDAFKTVDGEIMSVEEIIYTNFTDAKCPQLRRKPKLFFFNFCRGKIEQLQSDSWAPSSSFAVAPRDVAVIHAALPHFAAKRHPQQGTVFVNCLCDVLSGYAESLDLHDIVKNTSILMQDRQGTTASISNIDFGKFHFL